MDSLKSAEKDLVRKLQNGDEDTFEYVFKKHFQGLCLYAEHFLNDHSTAQNIVEDLFCELWENSGEINISISLEGYLYKSIFNRCLKHLRHKKVETKYQIEKQFFLNRDFVASGSADFRDPLISLISSELEEKISQAIERLPLQCRKIFMMSRFDEMSYPEIAEELGISVNTVKTQVARALDRLRLDLKDYMILIDSAILYSLAYSNLIESGISINT